MWVCGVCGLSLDDSLDSCPLGCGPRNANSANAPADGVNEGTAKSKMELETESSVETDTGGVHLKNLPGSKAQGWVEDADASVLAPAGANTVLVLTEGRTGSRIEIDSLACILGREGDYKPELFSEQVSRTHMEIHQSDGVWKARHIGTTNPSVLVTSHGRINMEAEIDYPLHDGERLRMANQTFVVNVEEKNSLHEEGSGQEPVDSQSESAAEADGVDDALIECWCVVCPKCGAKCPVGSESERKNECPTCTDPMDKREIRRKVPVFGKFKREELVDARG